MSAFLVSPQHIHLLVSYAKHTGVVRTDEDAARLARKLAEENIKSVEYRYPDMAGRSAQEFLTFASNDEYVNTCAHPWDDTPLPDNRWGVKVRRPLYIAVRQPVEVIKLAHSYEYQACEHPGWETSDACDFLRLIVKAACRALPGYDEAPWSV